MPRVNRLIIAATIVALVCNGCATKALMKAAAEPTTQKFQGTLRLLSASSDGNDAYLCFQHTAPDSQIETYVARIPVSGNKSFYISASGYQQPVIRMASDQISRGPCDGHGDAMPIVEITGENTLHLQAGTKESIYVKYADGNLQSLGYISSQPFYNRSGSGDATYSYAVDIDRSSILSVPGKKRTYLLVLLPVTVAADAVVAVGVGVFVVAYVFVAGCATSPGGCRGGS